MRDKGVISVYLLWNQHCQMCFDRILRWKDFWYIIPKKFMSRYMSCWFFFKVLSNKFLWQSLFLHLPSAKAKESTFFSFPLWFSTTFTYYDTHNQKRGPIKWRRSANCQGTVSKNTWDNMKIYSTKGNKIRNNQSSQGFPILQLD